eukprot:2747028-Amphidinium_carterae.1
MATEAMCEERCTRGQHVDKLQGYRATHMACQLGHLRNLAWLIENNADLNASTAPALELSADICAVASHSDHCVLD